MLNRRALITGLISLVAAPAIVRATSIMPIKALPSAEDLLKIRMNAVYELTRKHLVDSLYGDLIDVTRQARRQRNCSGRCSGIHQSGGREWQIRRDWKTLLGQPFAFSPQKRYTESRSRALPATCRFSGGQFPDRLTLHRDGSDNPSLLRVGATVSDPSSYTSLYLPQPLTAE